MIQSTTVVVPAYNAVGVIETALNSLLQQDFIPPKYEILVVDDASIDATADVTESFIEKAAAQGIVLKLLRQQKNGGPARARNRGAEEASGAIIVFTDSDCELTSRWLAEMLAPFADPNVAAVKGAYLSRQPELAARFAQAEFEDRYRMLDSATTVDVVFSYSAAFRSEVFRSLKGFDTRFPVADNEDTDLSWRLIEAGYKAVFNPRALLYHRHPTCLYQYYRKKISRGYWRVIVYRRFPGKAIKDSYTPQSLKLQILFAWAGLTGLVLALAWPVLIFPALLCLTAVLLSALPFSLSLMRRDPVLASLSPVLILGRALALGAGIIMALPMALRADPLGHSKLR
jgi:GT2 family glycosyltransferase